jgi:glycerophosphoryl diester phosphodiesterase
LKILAHRGLWTVPEEKNTRVAFERAIDSGFGIETDIRDFMGEIVVSHDPPTGVTQPLTELLRLVGDNDCLLALNIKSDGLSDKLSKISSAGGIVYFDMSGPEYVQFRKRGLNTLNRISEYETGYQFVDSDYGVWLDSFAEDDWRIEWLANHQPINRVFLPSPELHGRDHLRFWKALKKVRQGRDLTLCTDFPIEARDFFEENK